MANYKHVVCLLMAIALVPAHAFGNEPPRVVVKGRHGSSTVVVKGVRDPSAWFRIESQHLIVYSNDDPDDVIELVNSLERLDAVLRLYLKPFMDGREALPKLTLYFQGRGHWPAESGERARIDSRCVPGTQAFTYGMGKSRKLDNASLLRAEDDDTLSLNLWTYAENFLYRHTRIRAPQWFITGFAAYFGGMRFTDNQMLVGRDAGTSFNLLQKIDNGGTRRITFDAVLRDHVPSGHYAVGSHAYLKQWEFLGRSFNLVHYMLSSEDNRNKTVKYLESVNEGADPATAFDDVFGLAGLDLSATMWSYRETAMKVLQVEVPDLPRAHIDFTRLSRIEGDVLLDNAMLKTCPAPAEGRKLLERLKVTAARAPAVDPVQIALSRAQIDWGNPADAIGYLSRAVENDPYNPEPHYLLGLAQAKLAESAGQDKADLLAAARRGLTETAILAPEAPEVSYALFRVGLMDTDPTDKDMAKAIDAWRHGRDVAAFGRAAALAYAWLGDAAGAYEVFNTLARNLRDPGNAAWATSWLARLARGVPREELLAAMRAEQPGLAGYWTWVHDNR